MNKLPESNFWKKYSIVIIVLALVISTIVVTNIPKLSDFLTAEKVAGYYVALDNGYTGKSKLPSIARKALTGNAIVDLTNNARAANGLPPLDENHLLNSIAQSRARDMLEKQYFDHVSPTGEQVSDLAERVGYHYRIIAENIGSGDFISNQKIVESWMQSPDHRENILSTEVREIGAAVLKGSMKDSETYIAVQVFGLQSRPVSKKICVAPSDNLLHDIELKKAEIESLQDQLDRLKQELETEREAITTQRTHTEDDARKIHTLNIRINAFNEKGLWYNRMAEEAQAKSIVAESMINEYNKRVQTYNDCRNDTR
jgi:uncharacterized protein YkwD